MWFMMSTANGVCVDLLYIVKIMSLNVYPELRGSTINCIYVHTNSYYDFILQ